MKLDYICKTYNRCDGSTEFKIPLNNLTLMCVHRQLSSLAALYLDLLWTVHICTCMYICEKRELRLSLAILHAQGDWNTPIMGRTRTHLLHFTAYYVYHQLL